MSTTLSGDNSSDYDEIIERLFPKCRLRFVSKDLANVQVMDEKLRGEQLSAHIGAPDTSPQDINKASTQGDNCNYFIQTNDDGHLLHDGGDYLTAKEGMTDETTISNGCAINLDYSANPFCQNNDHFEDSSEEEELVIGNLPIAKYKGSPRRYGPKPMLSSASQDELTKCDIKLETNGKENLFTLKAQPGYPQRLFKNDWPKGHENSNNRAVDLETLSSSQVFCDELVKSLLAIPKSPLPSPNKDSSNCVDKKIKSSYPPDYSSTKENTCDTDIIKIASTNASTIKNNEKNYPNNANIHTTEMYQEKGKPCNGSIDIMARSLHATESAAFDLVTDNTKTDPISKKNEDKFSNSLPATDNLLGKKKDVRSPSSTSSQGKGPLPQLIARPPLHFISEYSMLKETCIDDVCHDVRNFSLSPDVTDCDSNEIESDLSIEDSLHSFNRYNQMPVLEDGLSCGVPSLDNDLDEDSGKNISSLNSSLRVEKDSQAPRETTFTASTENENVLGESIDYHNTLSTSNFTEKASYCHRYNLNAPYVLSPDSSPDKRSDRDGAITTYPGTCKRKSETKTCENDFRFVRNYQANTLPNCNRLGGISSESSEMGYSKVGQSEQINRRNLNSTQPKSSYVDEDPRKLDERSHLSEDCDTDQETDRLLGAQRAEEKNHCDEKTNGFSQKKNGSRENYPLPPSVLIEGVLFRARYLGSCQLVCEGQPTKATRMMQAEEAVSRIKDPDSENQPRPEVDLFISTEKIMVLNTDLKEIMMDHALRSISYIADIGDLLVLMTRRRVASSPEDPSENRIKRIPKMTCHVFESEEAQFIAQSIGQAFQVAFMEFLKANGIEDSSFVKEMDYQEVLNSQEIFGNELEMFARKDRQKEVIIPKHKGEILGMVIVESGWGSMLPTVVIANMAQQGPAARCGHLNIGDQIIAINGISLVGLPLSTCQQYIKNTKYQTAVKLTVVPCAPVVEVKIKRPDTKYQLGFSVQNGVICSLLRGGIAERGGVRVGHRIIEINDQSVVAVPHDRIVNLLATSVGEISMKTMPTSMFRLLTGQELPVYI